MWMMMNIIYTTYIGELDYTQLSKVTQTVMSSILIHDEGDILHGFGTEPFRHIASFFVSLRTVKKKKSK
ncbi:MAG: hypothetical protein ACI8RD_003654 [Bacillariaceae sp.]|jgi:hypothetical protein